MKKIVLLAFVIMLLPTALFVMLARPVDAEPGTIYIRADGSVEPLTANITSADNVTYTFNGNINDSIVVQRDNIVVDGASHTLQGTGNGTGITLSGRSNITIKNMRIKAFYYGIYLVGSSNNTITGNNVTNNFDGIYLVGSSNNTITGNNVTDNNNGILFNYSSNNFLQSNLLDGNQYGFGFLGLEMSQFLHSIDNSNLVNGKPVYYLVSKHNLTINSSTHPEVGFLALINSTNITVEGLTMSENRLGLLIAYTNSTKIQGNDMTNNVRGIHLYVSSNNTITRNNVRMNVAGIWLASSSNDTFYGNNIIMNSDGVELSSSSNNTLYGNSIKNNGRGIVLDFSSNNRIYHNNLTDNTQQVYIGTSGYANFWDDGYPSGGNYWSDSIGADLLRGSYQNETGSDGIGDTEYTVDANNTDRYPLWAPINIFDVGTWNGVNYYVDVISNSTVSDFYFNPDEGPFLRFNVTGGDGTTGFCRVTIPTDLLWVEDGEWSILVGGEYVNYTTTSGGNYNYIYLTYKHSTKTVIIIGTNVIPELPTWTSMLLILVVLTVATAIHKRRPPKTQIR